MCSLRAVQHLMLYRKLYMLKVGVQLHVVAVCEFGTRASQAAFSARGSCGGLVSVSFRKSAMLYS